MNQKYITVIITVVLVIVSSLTTFLLVRENEEQSKDYSNFTYLPSIKHADFKSKIENGETFYVYIGRPDCGDSRRFNEEFENLFVELDNKGDFVKVKYELDEKISYFDISEIIDSTRNKDKRDEYMDEYGFYFTPSLVAYEDLDGDGVSEVKNIAQWSAIHMFDTADYMHWFYANELITPNEEVFIDHSSTN